MLVLQVKSKGIRLDKISRKELLMVEFHLVHFKIKGTFSFTGHRPSYKRYNIVLYSEGVPNERVRQWKKYECVSRVVLFTVSKVQVEQSMG